MLPGHELPGIMVRLFRRRVGLPGHPGPGREAKQIPEPGQAVRQPGIEALLPEAGIRRARELIGQDAVFPGGVAVQLKGHIVVGAAEGHVQGLIAAHQMVFIGGDQECGGRVPVHLQITAEGSGLQHPVLQHRQLGADAGIDQHHGVGPGLPAAVLRRRLYLGFFPEGTRGRRHKSPGGEADDGHRIRPQVPLPGMLPDRADGPGRDDHDGRIQSSQTQGVFQYEGLKPLAIEGHGRRLVLLGRMHIEAAAGTHQHHRQGIGGHHGPGLMEAAAQPCGARIVQGKSKVFHGKLPFLFLQG